jgi:hypothetical protein
MAEFLRHEKESEQDLIWRLTLMKKSHLTVTVEVMKTATAGCENTASGSQFNVWVRPQHAWNSGAVHPFLVVPVD